PSLAQPEWTRHALPRCAAGFPKARPPIIGGVTQHGPHHGSLPTRSGLACGHGVVVQPPSDCPNAHARNRVVLVDLSYDTGLCVDHRVGGRRVGTLANVLIAIRRATQHADLAALRAMALAPA